MPQASDELRAKWDEVTAQIEVAKYFQEKAGWFSIIPGQEPSDEAWSALQYLQDEWDYAFTLTPDEEPEVKNTFDPLGYRKIKNGLDKGIRALEEALAYLDTLANFGGTIEQARQLAAKGIKAVGKIYGVEDDESKGQ